MKYCFIFFILLLSVRTVAQPGHLSVFYPENDLYKKLKVKAVIDSFMIVPANSRIIEYDTSGRELNSYYSSCISCAGYRSFVFTRQGDTLYRTKPSGDTSTGKIFSFERFIYSRTGKIMSYALSHKSYTLEKEIY